MLARLRGPAGWLPPGSELLGLSETLPPASLRLCVSETGGVSLLDVPSEDYGFLGGPEGGDSSGGKPSETRRNASTVFQISSFVKCRTSLLLSY